LHEFRYKDAGSTVRVPHTKCIKTGTNNRSKLKLKEIKLYMCSILAHIMAGR